MCVSCQVNTEQCVIRSIPWVEEDELHVQAGSEHEHVAVQFDLSDGAGRQRVSHGHQPHVLIAAIERGHVQTVLTDLQVAATVNHLSQEFKTWTWTVWIWVTENMSGRVKYAWYVWNVANLAKTFWLWLLDNVRNILFSSVCQLIYCKVQSFQSYHIIFSIDAAAELVSRVHKRF